MHQKGKKITEISSIRGGPHGKHEMENGQADLRAKGQPNPTLNPIPAATKEISVQQPKEPNSANHLNEHSNRFIPRASRKECSSTKDLILAQLDLYQTSGLPELSVFNLYCLSH